MIPGIGSLFGSGSVAVAGGASTNAIGRVLARHFEQGGTFPDLDLAQIRRWLGREGARGRSVAARAFSRGESAGSGTAAGDRADSAH